MKYKDWLDEWLTYYVKTSSKQRTYERYSQVASTHVIPYLGEYELSELQPIELQRFVTSLLTNGNKRTGKGLSPNSIKSIISVVQGSLKTANILGLTPEYTASKIKRPKIIEKQVECFTISEQKQIEQYIQDNDKQKLKGIILCLYTGLRIGELLALTWDDIDFSRGVLSVNKTCRDANKDGVRCVIIDSPKTGTSSRRIPLSKPMLAILKEMKKHADCFHVLSDNANLYFYAVINEHLNCCLKS